MSIQDSLGEEENIDEKKEAVEKPEAEDEWEEDQDFDDGEVVKLNPGESIVGLYQDKVRSAKHNCMCYKIKVKGDDVPKVILGTTILEKMMETKEIGEEVKIERLEDGVNQAGVTYQKWKTYHKKKAE